MSDLEVFPIAIPGGVNQSSPTPEESDFEELKNFGIFRNRLGLRAPLSVIATVLDDQGTPAEVDAILDIVDHQGKLWTASWSSSQQDVYLHSMQVDGTSLTLEAVLWTGVVSKPVVKLTSFEGGTATAGVARLYASDYNQNLATVYWNGSTVTTLAEDLDNNSSAENIEFSLTIPYKFHLWGTGFYEGTTDRPEMVRFSQPGLIPSTDPAGGANPKEWHSFDHRSLGRRGDKLVAVAKAGDTLLLFQKRAIHAIFGSGANTWTRRELSDVIGCVGPHAVATVDERVAYFWASDGPYRTDGATLQYIGTPVRQLAVEMDASESDTRVGYSPDDGLVYFLVSLGGADNYSFCLIFDHRRERWMTAEWYKDDAFVTADNLEFVSYDTGIQYFGLTDIAQSFTTPGEVGPIRELSLWLNKKGTPSGFTTLTAHIYAHTGTYGTSSLPTGAALTSSTARPIGDVTTVWPNAEEYVFTFPGDFTPDINENYVLVLTADGSGPDADNTIYVAATTGGTAHDGNASWNLISGGWTASANTDLHFGIRTSPPGGGTPVEFGALAFLDSAAAPGPAGAPTSVAAVATSDTEITVSWVNGDTNIDTETHIYRFTTTGFTPNDATNRVAVIDSAETSFQDDRLTPDTTYYYKIRHYRNSSHSAESAEVNEDTWLATPTAVGLAGITNGLTITGTNNASGADIEIERKITSGSYANITTLAAPGGSFSYDDTTAVCGTTYFYRTRASNAPATASPYSAEVSRAACAATTAPNPPTGLSATAVSETQINLAWTDNSDNENTFEIWRSTDGGSVYTLLAVVTANTVAYSDTGLASNTEYYYKVLAANSAGDSAFSGADNATTDPNLDGPTDLSATVVSPSQIDLTWTDDADDETSWEVHQTDIGSGGPYTKVATLSVGSESYSVTGLSQNTQYWFKVRAVSGATNGSFSNEATATTTTTTAPTAPSGLTAIKNVGSPTDTIDLAWTDNSGDETGFEVWRDAGGGYVLVTTTAADAVAYQDTPLDPGGTYTYKVRAVNASGNSAFSNTASDTTDGSLAVPAAPSGLVATGDDADLGGVEVSAVDVSWVDNSTTETSFTLERCSGAGCTTWAVVATLAAGVTSYRDTGVTDNPTTSQTYRYRVKASNGTGDSSYSSIAEATVEPQVKPSGLLVTDTSFCDAPAASVPTPQLTLTWANGDVTGLVSREVQRSTNGSSYTTIQTWTSSPEGELTYVDSAVSAGFSYWYRIRDNHGTTGENTGSFTSDAVGPTIPVPPDCGDK